MGVHGLWKLIESSGKPVPLETLENKILAVDVSIWLHQAVKGFQDNKGAPVPNAHLLGIYHRVCKLLYFKIKPIFVFDGGVPALKKQTIAKRNQHRSKNACEADRLQRQLLSTLLKHTAISKVLSEKTKASLPLPKKSSGKYDNLYALPPTELDSTLSSSDDELEEISESSTDSSPTKQWDLHTIDTTSPYFKTLPLEVKHEILTDLKETRKQNSWGKLHQLPKQSDDFSCYQMKRLLKRKEVQNALEEVSKEMGGMSLSLAELESLLNDQGIKTTNDSTIGKRIASDDTTRYLYIQDIQEEIKKAKYADREKNNAVAEEEIEEEEELKKAIQLSLEESPSTSGVEIKEQKATTKADLEEEEDLRKAIQLSLVDTPSSSKISFSESFNDEDFQSESDSEEATQQFKKPAPKTLSSAQNYMLEYSGLTPAEIDKIIGENGAPAVRKFNFKNSTRLKDTVEKFAETGQENGEKLPTDDELIDGSVETVEIMSDSGESDDSESSKPPLEIVIDPNGIEADDLFRDIFDEKTSSIDSNTNNRNVESTPPRIKEKIAETNKPFEIVLDPDKKEVTFEDCNKNNSRDEEFGTEIVDDTPNKEENVKDTMNNRSAAILESDKDEEMSAMRKLTMDQMRELKDNLQNEKIDLLKEKSNKERLANNITDQMYQEAQELLELFGVPYVVAPMEAEAQCAFLDEIELTNGTITDDSDIWLFGGKTVYKNFFNQSKYVMEFESENIESHFKLARRQMILLAMLVGSDYTTGLQGVGPVTALEILSSFPPNEMAPSDAQLLSGLREFKSWYTKGKTAGAGRFGLKNKLKNVIFADHFPNARVVRAYLEPKVETNRDPFSWSKPDITGLTVFAKEKFGWTMKKTEQILSPVVRKLEENQTQKSIKDYFKTTFRATSLDLEDKVSKRVKLAIDRIGKGADALIAEEMAELEKAKQKTVRKNSSTKTRKSKKEISTEDGNTEKPKQDINPSKEKVANKKTKITSKKKETETSNTQTKTTRNKKRKMVPEDETKSLEQMEALRDYENLALELKARRKRKTELMKIKLEEPAKKKSKIIPPPSVPLPETVPKELQDDEEVRFLAATSVHSDRRVEEIKTNVLKSLEEKPKPKKALPIIKNLHTKDVVHQKLRDKSDSLRNRIKAIEIFRKSKKGPGYVPKRDKTVPIPKEDAELSEDSD